MTKYSQRYGNTTPMTLPEIIKHEVRNAPDYHDGQLEGLERKVDKLTDLLCTVVGRMTEGRQTRIAEELGYHYEEEDDGE